MGVNLTKRATFTRWIILSCYKSSGGLATPILGEPLHSSRKLARERASYWQEQMSEGFRTSVGEVTW